MTTNVPKGAGRATATAKRTKHAQRTALPPKAGSPAAEAILAAKCEGGEEGHFAHMDANGECPWNHGDTERKEELRRSQPSNFISGEETRQMLAGLPAEKPMGERTVAELRKVASELLIPGARSMRRGDLLNSILEAEKAKASTAERLAGKDTVAEVFAAAEKSKPATPARAPKQRPARTPEPEPECTGDLNVPVTEAQGKSMAKAEAFLKAAAELGWSERARSAPEQETYGVIVGREEERITISWRAGVFVGEECYHSHPGRSPRKVINASAAKKIMAIPAAQAAEEAAKVSAHKLTRPRRDRGATATTAPRKALPFDPETATDEEVLEAVSGKTITWTNGVSGQIDQDQVGSHATIQPGKSGRSIRFTSATGFRSVRVSSILSIR